MRKFEEFYVARYLLNVESMAVLSTELKYLASGLIAPGNVSVHKAEEKGKKIAGSMGAKSIDAIHNFLKNCVQLFTWLFIIYIIFAILIGLVN